MELTLLLESTTEGIFGLDKEGYCTFANAAAAQMLGYRRQDLIGRLMHDLLHPRCETGSASGSCTLRPCQELTKAIRGIDDAISRNDGSTFPAEYTCAPIDRLVAMSTLIDGVSHEVNNPLFMISGYAQVGMQKLKMGRHENLDTDLAAILEATGRASAIIERFFKMAKSGHGLSVECHLHGLTEQALELCANDLMIGGITVERRFRLDVPPVLGDPQDIVQVLLNIISNARRAMVDANGRGVLTVSTESEIRAGRLWSVTSISDDGPGIPPDRQARLFETFGGREASSQLALGLGLPSCHRIIASLGGKIVCESIVGQGTTFKIRLPAVCSQDAVMQNKGV
jgi:PAS domain S-box-containing protein